VRDKRVMRLKLSGFLFSRLLRFPRKDERYNDVGMIGPTLVSMSGRRKRTYSGSELSEIAAGLRRLLDLIATGSLVADTATIRRLEGACAALDALAAGRPVDIGARLEAEPPSQS
jgi:hypothetical protein